MSQTPLSKHLEAGDRLDEFLDDYPSVAREQALAVLELAKKILAGERDEAAACGSRTTGTRWTAFTARA